MTDLEFSRFSEFVQNQCGIKMPLAKRTMLQSRLQKRLRLLGMNSFSAYADYVFSAKGREEELYNMIDAVTTNKTDFFRESKHFDYLSDVILPSMKDEIKTNGFRKLKGWSAGCSTGEEPYTLAMVLSNFAENNPAFNYSILATDISTKVLESAKMAIYAEEKIAPTPMEIRKKYLLRSISKPVVRIAPELRSCVQFIRLNFMDDDYGLRD
jgi:chemotaxis protein methyltransferase CheR